MDSQSNQSLLAPNDPQPVQMFNPEGRASFLLIGDHAGNLIPAALGTLGLAASDRKRHIAWDIGIAGLGPLLAAALDATFISQRFSRLVVDCNRHSSAPDAVATMSDGTLVPGNQNLSPADRAARFAEIHEPYQQAIAAELARRDDTGRETILVALHSFTPVMGSRPRPWHAGVLHHLGNTAVAKATLGLLAARGDLVVGDNEPYQMDGTDYTVPRHAYPRHRPYIELEIRQDLLETPAQQQRWSDILADTLAAAARGSDQPRLL